MNKSVISEVFKEGETIIFSLDVLDEAVKQMGGTLYRYKRKPVRCKMLELLTRGITNVVNIWLVKPENDETFYAEEKELEERIIKREV